MGIDVKGDIRVQILIGGIILLDFTYGVFFFGCSIDVGVDLEDSEQCRDIKIDGGNDNIFFFVAPLFKLIFLFKVSVGITQ